MQIQRKKEDKFDANTEKEREQVRCKYRERKRTSSMQIQRKKESKFDANTEKEREQVRCKYRDSPRQIDRSEASYPL
jgi:hypothetical protein